MRKTIILAMCWVFLLYLCACLFMPIDASAGENAQANYINIVYDDSGSMYKDGSEFYDKWYNANYAMSVFAAMLGSEDTLNIYPMGLEGGIGVTVLGADSPDSRATAIGNIEMMGSETYFSAVRSAYEDLSNRSGENRWLVILTDGKFSDEGTRGVESYLNTCAGGADPVNVVYLAIGEDAQTLNSQAGTRLYSYYAQGSNAILSNVTDIANKIFQNYQFDDSYIEKTGSGISLNFEVPMEKVTIFAQGEAITIGDLKSGQTTIPISEKVTVQASNSNLPTKYDADIVDELMTLIGQQKNLTGCIAAMGSGNELIPAGKLYGRYLRHIKCRGICQAGC